MSSRGGRDDSLDYPCGGVPVREAKNIVGLHPVWRALARETDVMHRKMEELLMSESFDPDDLDRIQD
jgi:hypothetical protein